MIDEKTLAEDEAELTRLQHHYRTYPDMTENFAKRSEIIRLARRYLALRESGNFSAISGFANPWGLRMTVAPLKQSEREQLDESADKLLECTK